MQPFFYRMIWPLAYCCHLMCRLGERRCWVLKYRRCLALLLLLIPVMHSTAAELRETGQTLRVLVLIKDKKVNSSQLYRLQLLREALALAPRHYPLDVVPKRLSGGDAKVLMHRQPEHWHIHSAMVTEDDYENFQVINIPLFKGLFGLRLALVNQSESDYLAGVKSVEDLRAFTAIQGSTWFDTKVLRHNKISVYGIDRYDRAYPMLHAKRVDFYPRSVLEIGDELREQNQYAMTIDSHVLLRYRAAMTFMLSKSVSKQAVADITAGLQALHRQGRIDQLLQQYFGEELAALALEKRQVLNLDAPMLPAPLQSLPAAYWYQPAQTLAR